MATDINLFIEKRNKDTGQWAEIVFYKKDNESFEPTRIWEGERYCETFDVLSSFSLPRGLPNDLSQEVRSLHKDTDFGETWYDYHELVSCIYTSYKFAWIDVEENSITVDRLKDLIRRINYLLYAYDVFRVEPYEVRIVIWFDC